MSACHYCTAVSLFIGGPGYFIVNLDFRLCPSQSFFQVWIVSISLCPYCPTVEYQEKYRVSCRALELFPCPEVCKALEAARRALVAAETDDPEEVPNC